jgi:hypothetical protein
MLKDARSVLVVEPKPLNAEYESLEWFSDNEDIVSISDRGVMVANSYGDATVTAIMEDIEGNSFSAVCVVNVIGPNSTEDILTSEIRIRVFRQTIQISNLVLGEDVCIYDLNGRLVKHQIAPDINMNIPMEHSGLYIVKIGGRKTQKIVIR